MSIQWFFHVFSQWFTDIFSEIDKNFRGKTENHKENFPSLPFKNEFGLPSEKTIEERWILHICKLFPHENLCLSITHVRDFAFGGDKRVVLAIRDIAPDVVFALKNRKIEGSRLYLSTMASGTNVYLHIKGIPRLQRWSFGVEGGCGKGVVAVSGSGGCGRQTVRRKKRDKMRRI